MLRHRLSKFSRATLVAMCVLFTGSFMSCTDTFDDYKYDDTDPNWLGASIYDFLKGETGEHTYNNYIAIIDSLGYADVLARTGSKTLFVADDAAFEEFYRNNRWGVKSISDLSKAQMKTLLYSAMLDNTYLLDMMSSLEGNPPVEGSCLRRATSAEAVDSIPYFSSDMLPKNNAYWDRFRAENGGKGLLLALDGTDPMMVHFLREFMKAKNITALDVNTIFNAPEGTPRSGDEAFIYQNQVLASGIDYGEYSDDTLTIACKNGYVYRMDGVLLPPSNMAQELRERTDTRIFSHLLDRFSAPVYSESLSESYNYQNNKTENRDSVFTMRYLNKSTNRPLYDVKGASAVITGDDDARARVLAFDPGWNKYIIESGTSADGDMAAMLIPSDEHIYDFFVSGTGKFLREVYAPNVSVELDNDGSNYYEAVIEALDSIPNDKLAPFINNLMLSSFTGAVPSKFGQIYNDGGELMGITPADVKECVVANNGVIYILNNVFGPAEYRSVSAPPLAMQNMTIMKAAINNLGYNSYLLAMDATYSFIVPDNNYFIYYDPVTIESSQPVAYQFFYNNKYRSGTNVSDKLWAKRFPYDPETYELLDSIANYAVEGSTVSETVGGAQRSTAFTWSDATTSSPAGFLRNRMTDLLEYLIIVGDVEDGNKYHQSKGYGTIKCEFNSAITDESGNPSAEAFTFYGGQQIENGQEIKVLTRYPQDNGVTYCTYSEGTDSLKSGIPTPPTQSVYYKLNPETSKNPEFSEFFKMCEAVCEGVYVDTDTDADAGLGDEPTEGDDDEVGDVTLTNLFEMMYPSLEAKTLNDTVKRYSVFYGTTSTTAGSNVPRDYAVPFFSTYHYTVYVPTNEAMKEIYDLGMPTWEQLLAELQTSDEGDGEEGTADPNLDKTGKVASYIRAINKFARYHFQDNSVYVDNKDFSMVTGSETSSEARFETAAINDKTGRFFETVVSTGNGSNGKKTIVVRDDMGHKITVLNTDDEEGVTWNVMSRDLLLNCKQGSRGINNSGYGVAIETSSFAVIHQVDKILLNSALFGYDGKFCRYANNGELVDTMKVSGVSTGYVGDKYLVGSVRDIVVEDAEGNDTYKRVAYLMKPIAGSSDIFNMEEYVLDANNSKILITNDGYRVAEIVKTNSKGVVISVTYKWADKDGNYTYTDEADGKEKEYDTPQVRYNNDGSIIG